MICLQKSLVLSYRNDKTTCQEINNIAFSSYASCYVNSGVCLLPPADWDLILHTINCEDLFLGPASMQVLSTIAKCVKLYAFLVKKYVCQLK
ncbi:subtilisin-like serine protease precursor [Gigaspora margarita]|uniref:Subtilisin-like serine protease n=1 Tax=Gigaspora margarita TaxID=4874 RepID=A0A8H4A328_GIGMA|nr:subtilisin-like serine protease precursor [Gigaspora margarita]